MLAALVDEFSPTALEPRDDEVRVFFATPADRDAAHSALTTQFDVAVVDVPDEDWARRSQENLGPITVGAITIVPNQSPFTNPNQSLFTNPNQSPFANPPNPQPPTPNPLVITPSMGFGTGHHATTRLCLAALQTMALEGREVIDVGTGSGILAIAAARLGARSALGIDNDADAVQSARENLAQNAGVRGVTFEVRDLMTSPLPHADVVTANLTGALLVRASRVLVDAARRGGALILSGLLAGERDAVARAFAPAEIIWESEEDGWVGLAVKKS